MKHNNNHLRSLAYQKAREISPQELDNVGGGESSSASAFTTKQTFNTQGNCDVGLDVHW